MSGVKRVLWCAGPSLVLSAAMLLPYLQKAYTVDDTLFLKQAQHVLVDPLHPTAFDMVWREVPERLSAIMPSGGVAAYLLVPAVLHRGAEWIAHLTQLGVLWAALLATVAIGLRLGMSGATAALAGLVLAATPAVLGMAATVMPDVAAMALGAIGMERLLAWREDRRWTRGLAAALALGAAPLARSHLIMLWPVAALALAADDEQLWSLRAWERGPHERWLPLLGAVLFAAIAVRVSADPKPGGASIVDAANTFASLLAFDKNLSSFLLHWMWSMPLGLVWGTLRLRALLRQRMIWFAWPASAVVLFDAGQRGRLWMAVVAGLGAAVLTDILVDAWKRRDATQLMLGAWLLVALPLVVYVHLPPKYLIASAPGAALLIARTLAAAPRRWAVPLATTTLVAGALLGGLIVHADTRLAELGRRAARQLIKPRVEGEARVWFAGHWGYQWYAEQAGARALQKVEPRARRGDLVVASTQADATVLNSYSDRKERFHITDARPGGRVMSGPQNAGFYSNWWGFLPWAWGSDEIDRYTVWEIQ